MTRGVHINNLSEKLWCDTRRITELFHLLDTFEHPSIPLGELSVAFVSLETIKNIHRRFLNDPDATDVITFPGDSAFDFAGEICVCVDVAIDFARQNSIDFSEELTRYLIHGWLHLAGYDDNTIALQKGMREMEERLLEAIKGENANLSTDSLFGITDVNPSNG